MADDSKPEWMNNVLKAWATIAFALEAWQAASQGELHSDKKLRTSHFANDAAHL